MVGLERNNLNFKFGKYVSLNILSMLGLSCFIFVDTLCVANGVGSEGLAALNLALPVYSVVSGIGLMIGMGGATRFSMLVGIGDEAGAKAVFTQAVKLAVGFGLLLMVVGLTAAKHLCMALGADKEILGNMLPYLKTILLFSPAFLLNNVMVCFVRNDMAPQTAMAAMLTGSFSNIILDILFVFGLRWGMFGAAFATGIAPLLSLCVSYTHVWRGKNHFCLLRKRMAMSDVARIMSLGMSAFIGEVSSGIVMLLFNFTVLRLAGNTGVAAYGVIANIALIVGSIFNGIGQGVQPIVSSGYGSGRKGDIRTVTRKGVVLAFLCGLACYAGGVLFANPIVAIFNHSGDAGFSGIAIQGIRVYFLAFIPMGVNMVMSAILAAGNKARESMVIALLRGVILNVVFVLIFSNLAGMTGVWAAVPVTESVTFLICMFMQKKKV